MGAVGMDQAKNERRALDPRERELIVAYLSYALDDVRAVSEVGLQFLQLTIASIAQETVAPENSDPVSPVVSWN
jgi:alkylhydroperoxidase/carboxymuconolactone decarboxylase family protein YurZ